MNHGRWLEGYKGLVDVGYAKHYRAPHGVNEFARANTHINGIEIILILYHKEVDKYNGIAQDTFYLPLKTSAFRFNHRDQNLYAKLLATLQNSPI